jgi:hypothetical protein
MLGNLFRHQARNLLVSRFAPQLNRQCKKSLLALHTTQKSILSQRAFSISRPTFSDALPVSRPAETTAESAETPENAKTVPVDNAPTANRTLYMGNMPFSVDEEEVKNLFAQYGEIRRIELGTSHSTLLCQVIHILLLPFL